MFGPFSPAPQAHLPAADFKLDPDREPFAPAQWLWHIGEWGGRMSLGGKRAARRWLKPTNSPAGILCPSRFSVRSLRKLLEFVRAGVNEELLR